ncbi:hypothetical protein Slala05_28020 [Streptomyces lavendulae subsp. lavendulae]|nr:hypothetical protein Slala05_28020 [Streptomyces lavendulae subsp. lavendulae]
MSLALTGRVLPAEDRRVLGAFAAQAAVVLDRQRLVDEAEEARRLVEGNQIRTALLAAVSHDLRTPLAGIKVAVTSLRSTDVEWSEEDRTELLEGIEDGADRLDHLIGDLLDMSRLQTGTVLPVIRVTGLDEVVPMALAGVPDDSVGLDTPRPCPWSPSTAGCWNGPSPTSSRTPSNTAPAGSPSTCPRVPSPAVSNFARLHPPRVSVGVTVRGRCIGRGRR